MDYALGRALTKRGAVFNIFNVKFPDRNKSKYCIVMEDYVDGMINIPVIFTTHRMEFIYQPSSVKVKDGTIKGISGETLIQCENWCLMSPDIFLDRKKSRYLCQLPLDIMKEVNDALTYIRDIDEVTLIRMLE